MKAVLITVSAVLGLAVGAFLNLVVSRLPRKVPVVRGGSRCLACEAPIPLADNLILVSWLGLGGKCRHCGAPIPRQALLVELGCAALFAVAAARFGGSWELPGFLVLFAALLAITVIDLEHFIIPNRILGPLTIASIPLLGLAAVGEGDGEAFVRAILGGVAAFAGLFVINLVYPRGMGMGDVKMSFVLGLYLGWLGWGEVMLGLFLAFLLGAVIGLALIALGLRSRKDFIPFGPFLALGTVVAILWGDPILRWYSGG